MEGVRAEEPGLEHASRDHKYRHSLQPRSAATETPLRHTRSQNYKRRAPTQPPIPELELVEEGARVAVERERKKGRKTSQASGRLGFDNAGFESDGARTSRNSSAANSVRSSTRESVQSLTVVREQYCCCSRWTPCERALFATVGVLVFIIIILVVGIVLVAVNNGSDKDAKSLFNSIFDINNV